MRGQKQLGFTIVELLIVVVVIAILATITIISYNGITRMARESAVKSELTSTAKSFEIDITTGTLDQTTIKNYLSKETSNVAIAYAYGDDRYYCLNAVDTTGTTYHIRSEDGISNVQQGECPDTIVSAATRCVAGRIVLPFYVRNESGDTVNFAATIYNKDGSTVIGSNSTTVAPGGAYNVTMLSAQHLTSVDAGIAKGTISYPSGSVYNVYHSFEARSC